MVMDSEKVLLGLSGGVDSTAAALLLSENGYTVVGCFLDMMGCLSKEALKAEKLASQLGIDFIYSDVSRDFEESIIDYFCSSYGKGETPNPCVFCNPQIKFATLISEADKRGIHWISTGHYARSDGQYIYKADNKSKDQSYMLYRLPQQVIRRLLLPLGEIETKDGVRQYVRAKGMYNYDNKDSQEICFIPGGSYVDFLKERGLNCLPGRFVDTFGNDLGSHKGIVYYTIGQRKGLGLDFGRKMFVIDIEGDTNKVVLGTNEELFSRRVVVKDFVFSGFTDDYEGIVGCFDGESVKAKIRYLAMPARCILSFPGRGRLIVDFDEPQRAAAPGQSIVFYSGDRMLGGGIITRS
ncbi:MAG: tRNA 2-thiouridine(34) synthase MnmA [Anaerovoracaceae bacterium]|jgi:tRNA-specific 2-thiouridylase